MKKIVHIITSLDRHGAQKFLFYLSKFQVENNYEINLITFKIKGQLTNDFSKIGINVVELNFKNSFFIEFVKLVKILRNKSPDIVFTWLPHANVIGGLATRIFTKSKLYWNMRQVRKANITDKFSTRIISSLSYMFPLFLPDKIIFNSYSAFKEYRNYNLKKINMVCIPNGVNIFSNNQKELLKTRLKSKKTLGLSSNTINLLYVGRWHPVKNLSSVFEAFSELKSNNYSIKLSLVGENMDKLNKPLINTLDELNIRNDVRLFGEVQKLHLFYESHDILLNCSLSESFPNTVAEAMERGTLCVVTNVGDSAEIIGKLGILVNEPNKKGILEGIKKSILLIKKDRQNDVFKRNRRMNSNYSIDKSFTAYLKI